MEIIEILAPLLTQRPRFTVNTAASPPSVAIANTWSNFVPFYNGAGKSKFVAGDNVVILSAGYMLPEQFAIAQTVPGSEGAGNYDQPVLSLNTYKISPATSYGIIVVDLILPLQNFELPLGAYFNSTGADGSGALLSGIQYTINGNFDPSLTRVSMVNVPAALNASVQYITPFIKVLHNNPLT